MQNSKYSQKLVADTESILKAKGTSLKNYMPKSQEKILNAVDNVIKNNQMALLEALKLCLYHADQLAENDTRGYARDEYYKQCSYIKNSIAQAEGK